MGDDNDGTLSDNSNRNNDSNTSPYVLDGTKINDSTDEKKPMSTNKQEFCSTSAKAATMMTATTMDDSNCLMSSNRYYILIEFVYKHLDFHIAELQSVLEMNGIHVSELTSWANYANSSNSSQQSLTLLDHDDDKMVHVVTLPNSNNKQQQDQTAGIAINDPPTDVDSNNSIAQEVLDATPNCDVDNCLESSKGQNDDTIKASLKDDQQSLQETTVPPVRKKNKGTARRPFLVLSFPADSPYIPCQQNYDSSSPSQNNNNNSKMDIASIILSRCVLVRSVIELWGMGTSFESCAECCHNYTQQQMQPTMNAAETPPAVSSFPTKSIGRYVYESNALSNEQSWKMTVHTLGTKYKREEQDDMRAHFSFLQLQGTVQMINPTNEFVLIREIELDALGSPIYPRFGINKEIIPENDSMPPIAIFFGRALSCASSASTPSMNNDIADHNDDENTTEAPSAASMSKRNSKRKSKRLNGIGIQYYSLKKRKYLGPTSMDAELSFIMTNFGQVSKGSCVFDPFVGTGSILLSCALRGAYVVGTDIDIRVLRGRDSNENIISNFKQYNLPRPELIRSDNSIYHRHYRYKNQQYPLYDAIVCDPPYGIRAGARKSGTRRTIVTPVLEENRHDHIAQTRPYAVSDVMADLLDVAARTLVPGGKLVYIIPSYQHDFNPTIDLPQHECLKLTHCCYQPLSIDLGRRVVVMEKIMSYDATKREYYISNVWANGGLASAEKCANIREKLIEAAKSKPNYEERKLMRTLKRKRLKVERKMQDSKLQRTSS